MTDDAAPAAQPADTRPVHPALRGRVSQAPYLPGLDGLRALAVIGVILYHADHSWLPGGFLGVEVFFVISGYLITLLLLGEHEREGRVALRAFWMRRARRLLPALFVMFGALAVFMAFFDRRPMGQTRGDFVAGLLYVSNWFQIWVGEGYTAAESFAPLRHLWSLAVEEQFYLVWPVVMAVLLKFRGSKITSTAVWLLAGSILVTVAMALLFVDGSVYVGSDVVTGALSCGASESQGYTRLLGRCVNVNEALYLSTITRAGGLMLGAAFAMIWRPYAIMRSPMARRGHAVDIVAVLAILVLGGMMALLHLADPADGSFDPRLFRGGFFVVGLCTVAVVAAITHRRSWLGRFLGMRPLRWLGTRSYGLYLYHWPVYQVLREPGGSLTLAQFGIALLVAVPLTELSYRLVESPIRHGRLGEWFRGQRPARTKAVFRRRRRVVLVSLAASGLLGYSGYSIAMAEQLCIGTVTCASEEGREAIEAAASSVPDTTTTSTVAPTTTTTEPSELPGHLDRDPTTTTIPATTSTWELGPEDRYPPLAVGESVMLGAAEQLQALGIVVDAGVSRQGTNIAEVVAEWDAADRIGRTVVIQTGTNGPVSDATLDEIMRHLPDSTVFKVVFLTVRAPRSWIADNNERIRALPDRYPNVVVVDWEAEAEEIRSHLTGSDGGIHLSDDTAKEFYAALVAEAVDGP
ncbi:MAG: hypothetical protein RLZ04_1541 [Actinomycetota bacterium]